MTTLINTFDVKTFLANVGVCKTVLPFRKGSGIFAQGDMCDSLFFVDEGNVKLTVVSQIGKEATIAILNPGDFAGEECVSTAQRFRSTTATAHTDCAVLRIRKADMMNALHNENSMSEYFIAYLLARTSRIQADLVDQLFNSSEKRLARTLLLLANFGTEGDEETLIPQISQETLAAMVGCTRSRVNFFLNRFRRLGFIEYDHRIRVHKSLLQIVLHD